MCTQNQQHVVISHSLTEEKCHNFREFTFLVLGLRSFRSCDGIYFPNIEQIQIDSRAGWFFLGKKQIAWHWWEEISIEVNELRSKISNCTNCNFRQPRYKERQHCVNCEYKFSYKCCNWLKIWLHESWNCLFSKACFLVGFILNEQCGKYEGETDVNV